ncbi:DUF2190 family protein [Sphingomonas sp. PAMC 26621]|uniref:DUF2190 family protein n=1 Tax=Sphingomonas sp. PAMC 26621 TaxID=1112213 RepID=UPI000288235A|nr:DUF2190 family protein [Sphingomonas sp. PAMC 26621]
MAKNYVQPGETLTLIAPRAVSSGSGLLVGALFAVALADAASGSQVEARRVGVWDLAKAAGAWTQGQKVYWDNAAFNLTTTATSNTLVGVVAQAQASADTVGRVLLTGQVS